MAVKDNFDRILKIASSDDAEVRLAAIHVLAQFQDRVETVRELIFDSLSNESNSLFRAGYLLLLGQVQDGSEKSVEIILSGLDASEVERIAAMVSLADLNIRNLPKSAITQLVDLNMETVEAYITGLPWDASGDIQDVEIEDYVDSFDVTDSDRVSNRQEGQ